MTEGFLLDSWRLQRLWKGSEVMCLAVPGEIINTLGNAAKVSIMGVETIINTQLVEKAGIGDYVLIHAGCAIEKIDKAYYDDLVNIFKSMLDEEVRENG